MTLSLLRDPPTGSAAPLPGMVGDHPLMREVYRLVRQAAGTDAPVAVIGETGTGKELIARALHDLSPRRTGPFVAVNAAALPETLFESELFGHERGAFSDARQAKPGLLELAHRGTFFCDEIATLSPICQAKLLRVVEDGVTRRVGGIELRPAAPRWVVSCQGYDPMKKIARGLRDDLWYRLSGVMVVLPALRDRSSDIPALVMHFLAADEFDPEQVEPTALDLLVRAPWPGNVRELKQVVGRLALAANGSGITETAVCAELHRQVDPRHDAARAELVEVLTSCDWDIRRAMDRLGKSRATLYRRLRALGIEREGRRSAPAAVSQSLHVSHASQRRL
jgi:two-component system, NtrC family, response regulator AtoC